MRIGTIAENEDEARMLRDNAVHVPFFDTHVAVLLAHSVASATRLGVFDVLVKGPQSSAEVAQAVGIAAPAADKLLNALRGSGYLALVAEGYALTPLAETWLVSGAPRTIRDYVYELPVCEWRYLDGLEAYLATGVPLGMHRQMNSEQWRLYQAGMRALATFTAPELVERVKVPDGAVRMADIGGSHGYFTVAFCRAYPNMHGVVFDLPGAVEQAAALLRKEGMGPQVKHEAVDALTHDFGQEVYDLILLSSIVHHFNELQNQDLVARCAVALKPGGALVILDGFRPEERTQLGQVAALIDLFCAMASGGGTWSITEMSHWQKTAGLRIEEPIYLRSSPGLVLQVARKRPVVR